MAPVRPVGRLVLTGNPTNFFAATEQVAFHVGNLPPGIDVTHDPLLQMRLFSYVVTQLPRLGGTNLRHPPHNRLLPPCPHMPPDATPPHLLARGAEPSPP